MTPNVGDALTPWLIEKLGLYDTAWVSPGFASEHYIATGSVLNWANEHSVVWGAGLASWKDEVNPHADIRAVRGPLSLLRLRSMGWKGPREVIRHAAVGDPALLLPKLVQPQGNRHHGKSGIIPHYADMARFTSDDAEKILAAHNAVLIDPLLPVEEFCWQVAACSRIVSSSLHGLIVADAYGIPNMWAKFGDNIGGDGMKYWDHMAAVGRTPFDLPPYWADYRMLSVAEMLADFGKVRDDQIPAMTRECLHAVQDWLLKTCPFLHATVKL